MKKIFFFCLLLMQLFAVRAQLDTLANFSFTDTFTTYGYPPATGWGYVTGHNFSGDLAMAEYFNYNGPPTTLSVLHIAFATGVVSSATSTLTLKIWDKDANGKPGNVLGSQLVSMQDIDSGGNFTMVSFGTNTIAGPFFVGFDLTYIPPIDTIAVFSTTDGNTVPGTAWRRQSDGQWHAFSEPTNLNINISLLIVPVLGIPPNRLMGNVFHDLDGNCSLGGSEVGIKNIKINAWNNNGFQASTYTNVSGDYTIYLPDTSSYFVQPDSNFIPFQFPACLGPNPPQTVWLAGTANQDFPMECKSGLDVGAFWLSRTQWVFPGQNHEFYFYAGNYSLWFSPYCGMTNISGQVVVTINGPVTYMGVPPGSLIPTVSGNTYTYSIPDFDSLSPSSFRIILKTDTSAQIGEMICTNVLVTPLAGDISPSNNNRNFCYGVMNSFDPNIKEVYPQQVSPGFDDFLTYTIHFQNTGNAPAFNIRLRDTLDSQLAIETFELLGYSHSNQVTLNSNYLSVYFPNIMLMDSLTDPLGSMGYVQYRIKPKNPMVNLAQIHNSASIYFDYNAPIQTNTATTVCELTNGVQETVAESDFRLFPNPVTSQFTITTINAYQLLRVSVYNLHGVELSTTSFKGNEEVVVDLDGQPGLYIVKVVADKQAAAFLKLLKE